MASYKKQFQEAKRQLAFSRKEILEIDSQIEELQRKKIEAERKYERDRENKVVKGMLYYSSEKRSELLKKAEELQFSKATIERLRQINGDQWNLDNVNNNLIEDFEAIEAYVMENMPSWEKLLITRIGRFSINDE